MTENNSYLVNNLTIVTLLLAIIYFSKSIFFFFSSNHLISYSPNFCKICRKKKRKNARGKKSNHLYVLKVKESGGYAQPYLCRHGKDICHI